MLKLIVTYIVLELVSFILSTISNVACNIIADLLTPKVSNLIHKIFKK